MTNMVTRCPQCSTSFRITPIQIQKARGAVRCGSCLHIFKAQEHLVENAVELSSKKAAVKKSAPRKKAKPPAPQQETLDIPSPAETAHDTAKTSTEVIPEKAQQATSKASPSSTTHTSEKAEPTKEINTENASSRSLSFNQKQIDTESLPDDEFLISDDMDKPSSSEDDAENNFYLEPTQPASSLFDGKQDEIIDEFIDSSDESWTDELLEKTQEQEPLPKPSQTHQAEPTTEKKQIPAQKATTLAERLANRDTSNTQIFPPPHTPSEEAKPTAPNPSFHIQADTDESDENTHYEHISAFNSDRAAMVMNIDPEPLEIIGADTEDKRTKLLWSGLSALALLLLAMQIAYFQFDKLSRMEPYRGYYQSLCSVIGCDLPVLIDTGKIRAYNLVVRNHPETAGTLIVDAIILNGATFSQPYPHLALEFSDLSNKPVASRDFSPEEYLHGELRGSKIMQQNQPIHISLELVDPGENAVNYRIFTP